MLPEFFYIINFSYAILISSLSSVISITTILIVYKNRQFRTFNNVLTCNTCIAALFYSMVTIATSIYGFREDWALNAPLCSFRAFCYNVGVASICHSKSMHAISRLFFSVYYKHHCLLTWRCHHILIGLTWIISIIVCIPPFFVEGGYALEEESRSCVLSSKVYLLALYITVVSCIIPFNIIASVYIQILLHVRRSTRRVWAFHQNTNNDVRKSKREMKLMKQMIIQTSVLISGGPIFLFLVGWHAITDQPPPESLYLLGFNLLTTVGALAPFVQFIMNKQLKEFLIQFLERSQRTTIIKRPIHQLQQAWHIT
jgi:hypothetical protein